MARIAIIGSGISGLGCADLLRDRHEIVVFESAARAGGHARTLSVAGTPVDTGFIVYNEINYPLLTRFFTDLRVATKPSDMSFGFSTAGGAFEYSASSISGLLAQPRNLLSPAYWSMLRDILRFFKCAPSVLDAPAVTTSAVTTSAVTTSAEMTLGELLDAHAFGQPFRDRFLIPMGAAIWSTPAEQMLAFPAKTFVRFFQNHGLLSVSDHHPWRTVVDGSESYVAAMQRRLGDRLRLSTPIADVTATAAGISVKPAAHPAEMFDEVVFACHADTALALLGGDATANQRRVLSAFAFRDNTAVLHSDARLMPRARRAWSSWNYVAPANGDSATITLTYWMNRLQSLAGPNLFVTLNPVTDIASEHVHDRHVFRHPVFTHAALAGQAALADIQGQRHVWFCGAWQRYGFHEDGIWSAHRVAQALGGSAAWA